jgi:hypothetical protein
MLKCTSNLPARKIAHCVHEAALDKARAIANTEACACRATSARKSRRCLPVSSALKLNRQRLSGPNGAKDEFRARTN